MVVEPHGLSFRGCNGVATMMGMETAAFASGARVRIEFAIG